MRIRWHLLQNPFQTFRPLVHATIFEKQLIFEVPYTYFGCENFLGKEIRVKRKQPVEQEAVVASTSERLGGRVAFEPP